MVREGHKSGQLAGQKQRNRGSFLTSTLSFFDKVKKMEIKNKENFDIHKIFEQLNHYVLNQEGYPDFIEGKILESILEESKYREKNKKIEKIKLACKPDWGNSGYCGNCLSVDNCPVKWGYRKWKRNIEIT